MTTRATRIEEALRRLVMDIARGDNDAVKLRQSALDEGRTVLALPPDAPTATERERALVRAARGDVVRWEPRGKGETDRYVGVVPLTDAECDGIIASVGPRPETSAEEELLVRVAEYSRGRADGERDAQCRHGVKLDRANGCVVCPQPPGAREVVRAIADAYERVARFVEESLDPPNALSRSLVAGIRALSP